MQSPESTALLNKDAQVPRFLIPVGTGAYVMNFVPVPDYLTGPYLGFYWWRDNLGQL